MATAREHIESALGFRDLARKNPKMPSINVALLHVIADATIAIALALGADLPPLPDLDHYCLCPLTTPVEAFAHAADCPHSKPANDEGPAASTTEPNA